MDYKSLTLLLLRLTGVVILVAAAVAAPRDFLYIYIQNAGRTVNAESWLLTAAAAVFPMLVALLLIYFPTIVADRIVPGDGQATAQQATAQQAADIRHLEQIAFSVLGLYFVSMATFNAVSWYAKLRLYSIIFSSYSMGLIPSATNIDFAGIASTCAQFVAGIVLLLGGGRGLANLLHRLRFSSRALADMPSPLPETPAGQEARG